MREKKWTNANFRVWAAPWGEIVPEYQSLIRCISLDQTGPVLAGYMPESAWLHNAKFNSIELLSANCGNPMEYDPLNVRFRCHGAIAADYEIANLGAFSPDDLAVVEIFVHFHCEDVEWVYVK